MTPKNTENKTLVQTSEANLPVEQTKEEEVVGLRVKSRIKAGPRNTSC